MHYIPCVGEHTVNAGNLSYTVPMPVGRRNQMCKIEVHIKAKAYRIIFPKVQFHLVDSIGKKIKVVQEVAASLGLQNVQASHARAETIKDRYDFIVSRAVTQMPVFLTWVKGKSAKKNLHNLKNGVLYLKGGDLSEELAGLRYPVKEFPIADFFKEEFFETKKVVYVQLVP